MKFLKVFLLKVIAGLRWKLEGWFFKRRAPKNWQDLDDIMNWREAIALDERSFDFLINGMEYKSDPIKGLMDYSFPINKPEYFFKKLPFGRDCDDWARIWSAYYRFHHKVVEEWIVTTTKHPFKDSHFVAVVHEGDKFRLLDYSRWGLRDSAKEAVQSIGGHWEKYALDTLLAVRYHTWRPE